MSFLLRTLRASPRTSLRLSPPLTRTSLSHARPLTTTPLRQTDESHPREKASGGLSEDTSRTPEQVEQKKQEQIQKQREGKGEWHESLASQGESHIKADREEIEDHGEHMEDLQKEGAGSAEKGGMRPEGS